MKRILLVLPLALLFANCRTTERSITSSTTGTSGSTASASATMGTGTTGSTTGNVTASTTGSLGYDINKYDPNNYMQNPDKYKSPRELVGTGGWTYNTEWNQNTNFIPEALGQWLMTPTPEVAAHWIPDTSRPESYAWYWTPEAVAARQQERLAAAAAYNDSLARAEASSQLTASAGKGKTSARSRATAATGTGSTGTMGTGGISTTTGTGTDASASASATGTMSGTTGSATGTADANTSGTSMSASAGMDSAGMTSPQTASNTKNYLMAVNSNMFAMPKLNLYLQNGTYTGYTGSNPIVGTLKVNGTQLSFDQLIPSTNITGLAGFDQAAFLDRLRRTDSYDVTDGQLRLKQGDQVLLVLAKNTQL